MLRKWNYYDTVTPVADDVTEADAQPPSIDPRIVIGEIATVGNVRLSKKSVRGNFLYLLRQTCFFE